MMTERAMRQRMGTKPKAEPAGMRIAGPRHADMLRRAALLNQGAAIQRKPRAGAHKTAANLRALSALRQHRSDHPDESNRHVNNELEYAVVEHHGNDPTGQPLDIVHHVSDAYVQEFVLKFARKRDLDAEKALFALIEGINPGLNYVNVPDFHEAAQEKYDQANNSFLALRLTAVNPNLQSDDPLVTTLANAIANSPMNLHLGANSTNRSIGQMYDPNSHPVSTPGLGEGPPQLERQMTSRSWQMRNSLIDAGIDPVYRTLEEARDQMKEGSLAYRQAVEAEAKGWGNGAVQSSGSPDHFFNPN